MVSMASDNAGFWCAKYDTIRYEMLFYRALKSRHESASCKARKRQLKSVKKTEKLKSKNGYAYK